MIQTGLLSITFRKHSAEDIVNWVKEAGLEGIEWGGDLHVPPGNLDNAERIRLLTEKNGLKVLAYGSYYRCESDADPETDFTPILKTAHRLSAPLIRVWPGTLGSRDLSAKGRQVLVEHSRFIAQMAQEKGIVVACEYHGGTVTDTPESALRFIREVDHPNYRTLWQPPVGMSFEDSLKSLKEILPWLENVHVFHWWPTSRERQPLVEGRNRWEAYLDVLRASGRDHACLLEFVRGDSPDQFLEDAATLRDMVRA